MIQTRSNVRLKLPPSVAQCPADGGTVIQRMQNSPLTRWLWRMWQHEETGRVVQDVPSEQVYESKVGK